MIKKEVRDNFIKDNKVSYGYLLRVRIVGIVGVLYSITMIACNYFFDIFGKWDYYLDISVLVISLVFVILSFVILDKLALKYQLKKYNDKKKGKKNGK